MKHVRLQQAEKNKEHVGDQNFITFWFLKLSIEDRSNFALNLTLQAIFFSKNQKFKK
jgi:hypothetical protein